MNEVPFTELLADIVDNRGRTCPVADDGLPLIATNCISNERLYPTYDTTRRVSDETYRTWFRGHPIPGDLIFVCKGSPGRVCMAPNPVDFCIAQDMVAVRPEPAKVYPKYLFAALRSSLVQARIVNMHVGSLIPHFKKGDFNKLTIPLPDVLTQQAIGDLYFELSAKIEQNRRTAQALEGLARAIFRAWFVEFEPVRAKAAGATSFPSMPQLIFDALPARFVDSDIGPVPEGWGVKAIGDVVTLKGGGTPSTKNGEFWDNGTHYWATPKDMSRLAHPVLLDTDRRITDAGVESISSGVLPVGTVLMSSRAPVGYLAIACVPTAINQGFISMVCDGPLPPVFVLNWAASSMDTIKAHASGTTFPEISKRSFRPLPIINPDVQCVDAYRSIVDPLFSLLVAAIKESGRLAEIRDYLLPQLLSGSVRVSHD